MQFPGDNSIHSCHILFCHFGKQLKSFSIFTCVPSSFCLGYSWLHWFSVLVIGTKVRTFQKMFWHRTWRTSMVQVDLDHAHLFWSDQGLAAWFGPWSVGGFTPVILVWIKLKVWKFGPNNIGVSPETGNTHYLGKKINSNHCGFETQNWVCVTSIFTSQRGFNLQSNILYLISEWNSNYWHSIKKIPRITILQTVMRSSPHDARHHIHKHRGGYAEFAICCSIFWSAYIAWF